MTDNDFQLRLRPIMTLKKQTMTNNDNDNDLIIPDSEFLMVKKCPVDEWSIIQAVIQTSG